MRPRNFAADPMVMLLASLGPRGVSQAVEEQEATGGAEMANPACEVLPVAVRAPSEAELERLGFVLGEVDPDDPLFREASLPPGWTRRRTAHPVHTDLVDAQGRKRGSIFYKASAHDRRAQMYVFPDAPEDES
ncbi:hypothetical protein [Nocardiopsis dassonvillei]|uniref:hypothetical protein n=1 Tax=Nocardiopsis dassonvillei TaxID=2014 RepID=UPI00363C3BBC